MSGLRRSGDGTIRSALACAPARANVPARPWRPHPPIPARPPPLPTHTPPLPSALNGLHTPAPPFAATWDSIAGVRACAQRIALAPAPPVQGAQVWAVDLSPVAAAHARFNADQCGVGPNVQVRRRVGMWGLRVSLHVVGRSCMYFRVVGRSWA